MERERLGNGRYRVFLSDEELQDWGLSFERLSVRSPCTRALLSALLVAASEGEPLSAEGMTAEVFPVEGGCFLLFSGEDGEPASEDRTPLCAAFSDVNALFSFCKAAKDVAAVSSSLMTYDDRPWLLLTPGGDQAARTAALLSEWDCFVTCGQAAAAFLAEHGTLVFCGDALERLNELG